MANIFRPAGGGSSSSAVGDSRFNLSSTPNWVIPGAGSPLSITTVPPSGNFLFYAPIRIDKAQSFDRIGTEIVTAAASGLTRLGIYNCDTDLQPTSLIVDSGDLDSSTTGVKSATISVTLQPGRYLLAMVNNSNGIAFRCIKAGMLAGLLPTLGSSPYVIRGTLAFSYAALPSTGPAFTAQNSASTPGVEYYALLRLSTP